MDTSDLPPGTDEARSAGSPTVPDPASPLTASAFVAGLRPIPTELGPVADQPSAGEPASDIVGSSPTGDAVEVCIGDIGGVVLVAFMATRCDGCEAFWQGFGGAGQPLLPPSVTPVIVTRGADTVAPAEVRRLAASTGAVQVIMSDDAWSDYRVFGYPFFVLVDASTRTVLAETVGFGWSDLIGLVRSSVP
ncbi:MAG: hypothetical protein ACRDYE_00630 [Acidimicrobiales bacterium]